VSRRRRREGRGAVPTRVQHDSTGGLRSTDERSVARDFVAGRARGAEAIGHHRRLGTARRRYPLGGRRGRAGVDGTVVPAQGRSPPRCVAFESSLGCRDDGGRWRGVPRHRDVGVAGWASLPDALGCRRGSGEHSGVASVDDHGERMGPGDQRRRSDHSLGLLVTRRQTRAPPRTTQLNRVFGMRDDQGRVPERAPRRGRPAPCCRAAGRPTREPPLGSAEIRGTPRESARTRTCGCSRVDRAGCGTGGRNRCRGR
jgi:hypothetical protein